MKVAVASEGETADSLVSSRGGRAPYYLVFEDKKLVEAIKNPFAAGGGGAGFGVAHLLAGRGVNKVVTGNIGGNMASALKEKGIEVSEEPGRKVEEVV